ncbi:extracellular solute-binding protein [Bifidobacterium biavatii]|uniref:Sugar ABC transporter substrate-binding protein n=1 Tax=Bifidobacterium biavatii DSM 23969 TaxID=1437608 RepID=A0A086ZYY9_9BIFI|nr:extracellular solute-binding protein [Bifidobacterium biavatii]KFI51739.1 sugar ABC transporter substrate-binding protein [Bifidobacterium biavatii DSM 23969]
MIRRNAAGAGLRSGKRITAITAGTLAMAMALAGCGAGNSGEKDADGKPVVKVQVIIGSATKQMKTMNWWKKLEAACDCTIKWQTTLDSQWNQQKSAILASGDIADLSIGAYSADDFAKNQIFEDLSDDLDKMPNAKKYLESDDFARRYATNLEGKLLQIPSDVSARNTNLVGGQTMMINKTWLDKLGLKVPTTWDEFTNVLKAFKTQDPNGNGKADEIPFDIRALGTGGFGWWGPYLLMNSTGIEYSVTTSGGTGIYVKDGKVGNYIVSDQFRQVTEYLHQLMADGLVPSDAITKTDDKYYAELKGDGKAPTVGVAFGWNTLDSFGTDFNDQYVTMAAPVAPGADKATWTTGQPDVYAGAAVKADSPYKEQVYKIIDKWLEPDMVVQSYYGDLDTYVTKNGDLDYTIKPEGQADPTVQVSLYNHGLAYLPEGIKIEGVDDVDRSNRDWMVYKDQQAATDSDDYLPNYVVPSDEDMTTISNNNTQIFDYATPIIASWIAKGGLDDASWKSYVEGVKNLGVEQNVELWQKWYDKYTK